MELIYDKLKLKQITRKYGLKFVILHGSYATGRVRKDSDLDIAVLGKKELAPRQYLNLYGELAELFGDVPDHELDIKILHRIDPFFRYEVVRDGVLLYGDPTAYEEFKAFSYRAYEDAKPLLRLERVLSEKYQKHLNVVAELYA